MYFYIYNGDVYWGRHQSIPPHRNVTTWVFRNKPAKANHTYTSGPYSFHISSPLPDGRLLLVVHWDDTDASYSQARIIEEGICYFLGRTDLIPCSSTDKHDIARQHFKNMFRNRLKEYAGRYFLPIDKHFRSI